MAEQLSMDDLVSNVLKEPTHTQPPAEPPIVSAAVVQEQPPVPPTTQTAAAAPLAIRRERMTPGHVVTTRELMDPDTMNQMVRVAQALAVCISDSKDAAREAFARILAGAELGMPPMASIQKIYFIKGRPALSADAMVGVCRSKGVRFKITHSDPPGEWCIVDATRPDGDTYGYKWTAAMAKAAGLTGANWNNFRPDMLFARAASHVCRKLCSDIIGGFYDPDELTALDSARVDATAADLQAGIERLDG
jgi:hypothetical protein